MTGLDSVKKTIDSAIMDARLSIEEKRAVLERSSEAYRMAKQYLNKNFKELGVYGEIKLLAAWDIKNRNGNIIFAEGDQLISTGDYSGNTKDRSMFREAHKLMTL